MTSGEILQAITLTSTLVIGVWTLWGKGKDTNYTRLEGERNRLDQRVAELEKGREEDRARLERVETELDDLKRVHYTLIDFLRDIVSGNFDEAWIKRRAADLLSRHGGGGTP
ncbi:DNA-binding protein [Deinococcus multiflagellatus]|uniref:DNA-binding protein n=1 Tax=Deinococcus multiflagellatus TaxID=1656887 RepID=UPI001CC926A0|nr:DNA-binding protein [Deinococcus multiflagellatus]MBZ9716153.1 DNA-binding protein [Deinococcus multiflagellatus]